MSENDGTGFLQLMQLADSALPIGTASHSFGLEGLAAESILSPENLFPFFEAYLEENGVLETVFCRAAFRLASVASQEFLDVWVNLNRRMSAMKPARESRIASATLGRRLLQLVLEVEEHPRLQEAFFVTKETGAEAHHAAVFGLIGAALKLEEDIVVAAYLQQSLTGLISACQRLMPVGQRQATRLLWELKPAIMGIVQESRGIDLDEVSCFAPLLDLGSMRHPTLSTRLFIS